MQITDLIVKFGRDGMHGFLHRNLLMKARKHKVDIWVPVGFKTDFASIPQAVRSLIPQLGKWTAPAVAHDFMYWCGPSMGFTQKKADAIFLELMEDAGVKWWRRQAIHKGLRIGGWTAWNDHRKKGHSIHNAIQEK